MLSKEQKKEAINNFKERKPALGIYSIRCTVTERVWVGASKNLPATKNGTWFALRNEVYRDKLLQDEWNTHGEPAFAYDVLETLADDVHAMAVNDLLSEKKKDWMSRLNAPGLL